MSTNSPAEPPFSPPPPFSSPPPPVPPVPPVPPPPPVARQLVRDPYTRMGGVASGIGHHYGIDVSLVRIAFVLFTLVTGFGLLIYLLCWLIIPRAKYWPPVATAKPIRALSGREVGVGLLLVGLLVTLFFTGGSFSRVMVPVVLIAGGVWLLAQPDSGHPEAGDTDHSRRATGAPTPQPFGPQAQAANRDLVDPVSVESAQPDWVDPAWSPPESGRSAATPSPGDMPRGTPVTTPRRRFRRRLWLLPILFVFVAIPAGIVVALATADIEIDFSSVTLTPETVSALPDSIVEGQGELVVDLTNLEPDMFTDGPVPLDINIDFGRVEIIVPDDLTVQVEANLDIGDLTVFDSNESGFEPQLTIDAENPELILDVRLGIGEIMIRRGD